MRNSKASSHPGRHPGNNLEDDLHEMNNLAENPACDDQLRHMFTLLWERVKTTGDHSLFNSHYPALRLASYGPNILEA